MTHNAVVLWVPVVLFCFLSAGVAYAGVRSIGARYTTRANAYAAASALVVALVAGVILARATRPWAAATTAAIDEGHPFSCARPLTASRDIAHGSVDVVQTVPNSVLVASAAAIDRGATLDVQGWATDSAVQHPIAGVCLLIDGKPLAREAVSYGASRPDVAQAFKVDAVTNTGFVIRAAAAELAPGRHRLEVVGVDERGRDSAIAPPLPVTVR